MKLVTFTEQDRELFKEAKAIAQGKQGDVQAWGKALVEIEKNEWWRIDGGQTMQEWCGTWVPFAYRLIRNMLERHQRLENERLIENTTGEPVIKKSKNKKRQKQHLAPNNPIQESSNNLSSHKRKEVDRMGVDIPEPRFPIWDRRGEIDSMIQSISDAKCRIDTMRKAQDPMYLKIKQEAVEALERAHYLVSKAVVYCVCGICGGWLETRNGVCEACKSTGFMTLEEYKLTVPEETRRVRENSIAARKAAK